MRTNGTFSVMIELLGVYRTWGTEGIVWSGGERFLHVGADEDGIVRGWTLTLEDGTFRRSDETLLDWEVRAYPDAVASLGDTVYCLEGGTLYRLNADRSVMTLRQDISGRFALLQQGLAVVAEDKAPRYLIDRDEFWYSNDKRYRGTDRQGRDWFAESARGEMNDGSYYILGNRVTVPSGNIQQLLIYPDGQVAIVSCETMHYVFRIASPGTGGAPDSVEATIRAMTFLLDPENPSTIIDRYLTLRDENEALAGQSRDCGQRLTVAQRRISDLDNEKTCPICMDAEKTHVFGSCGHMFCLACLTVLRARATASGSVFRCPTCQQPDSPGFARVFPFV